jgi:hypothetical protein
MFYDEVRVRTAEYILTIAKADLDSGLALLSKILDQLSPIWTSDPRLIRPAIEDIRQHIVAGQPQELALAATPPNPGLGPTTMTEEVVGLLETRFELERDLRLG